MPKPKTSSHDDALGVIDSRQAYTLTRFCRILGIAYRGQAYNELVRHGLKLRGPGKNKFVLGREFLELLSRDDGTDDNNNGSQADSSTAKTTVRLEKMV